MGRPRKEIDWSLLDALCGLDAQLDYCAEQQAKRWGEESSFKTIKAGREIIERRVKERFKCTFTEYKKQKIEPLRISLKKKQIEIAQAGNVSMLIWLGKQLLDQSDKLDQKTTATISHEHDFKIGFEDEQDDKADASAPHPSSKEDPRFQN